jgi:hypothetical protein
MYPHYVRLKRNITEPLIAPTPPVIVQFIVSPALKVLRAVGVTVPEVPKAEPAVASVIAPVVILVVPIRPVITISLTVKAPLTTAVIASIVPENGARSATIAVPASAVIVGILTTTGSGAMI